ncbi:MAG: TolC family protein [Prevotella sp.]|nr:TolC family protein [Bacteroidales bacterium]MDY3841529.1 TolC family protein [Prevotella sp.]
MNRIATLFVVGLSLMMAPLSAKARQWTLRQCIDYALENNISLQKTRLQRLSSMEDVKQSQAALLPSLNFGTTQNMTYNPWPQTGRAVVAGDQVQTSVDKIYYNGSYSLNANWTVWNGNANRNTIKANKIAAEKAALDSATTANSIQEKIAQLYVQILYSIDAKKVNESILATSKTNEQRGMEFVQQKKMSKADLAQLSAQRAQDEYNVVQAESSIRDYKRQLKQLLQITDDEEFDIEVPTTTDEMALQDIPELQGVYVSALAIRPEIQNAQLGIASSELQVKIAKAGRMPTVGLNAGFSTSTTSMNTTAWGTQLKNNFNVGAGFNVSIPLFDQRQTKTAVNKAEIQKQSYMLDLKDQQTTLYSTIENYWLQALTNQNMFKAAQESRRSAEESYHLLSEQFKYGLKNTVELLTGRDNLLKAQQSELQSKYLTVLNLDMLNFYKNGKM